MIDIKIAHRVQQILSNLMRSRNVCFREQRGKLFSAHASYPVRHAPNSGFDGLRQLTQASVSRRMTEGVALYFWK